MNSEIIFAISAKKGGWITGTFAVVFFCLFFVSCFSIPSRNSVVLLFLSWLFEASLEGLFDFVSVEVPSDEDQLADPGLALLPFAGGEASVDHHVHAL